MLIRFGRRAAHQNAEPGVPTFSLLIRAFTCRRAEVFRAVSNPHMRGRIAASVMLLTSLLIAYGGAMEFRYFGPGTSQFLAGLVATPAGLAGAFGAILLWRSRRRTPAVMICSMSLLAGTLAATALGVMGPPATLLGCIGAAVSIAVPGRV
jgi:hypothetical protein